MKKLAIFAHTLFPGAHSCDWKLPLDVSLAFDRECVANFAIITCSVRGVLKNERQSKRRRPVSILPTHKSAHADGCQGQVQGRNLRTPPARPPPRRAWDGRGCGGKRGARARAKSKQERNFALAVYKSLSPHGCTAAKMCVVAPSGATPREGEGVALRSTQSHSSPSPLLWILFFLYCDSFVPLQPLCLRANWD